MTDLGGLYVFWQSIFTHTKGEIVLKIVRLPQSTPLGTVARIFYFPLEEGQKKIPFCLADLGLLRKKKFF